MPINKVPRPFCKMDIYFCPFSASDAVSFLDFYRECYSRYIKRIPIMWETTYFLKFISGVFKISLSSIVIRFWMTDSETAHWAQMSHKIVCSQENTAKNTNQSIMLTTRFSEWPFHKLP